MTKHKVPGWRRGIVTTSKIDISCLNCMKIFKAYCGSYRKFCSEGCSREYRIGKKRPEHSEIMKQKHKEKVFGYKKGENTGANNPAKRPCIRSKIAISLRESWKRDKYRVSHSGVNSVTWIDGRSYTPYPPSFNRFLKSKIKERDSHRCQNCYKNSDMLKQPLTIHHIDYDKNNCSINNLITLCYRCNTKANTNRQYWQELYTEKVIQNV